MSEERGTAGAAVGSVHPEPRRRPTLLDRFYTAGIVVKGIDGAVELVAGLLLWFAPGLIHSALSGLVAEAQEGAARFDHVIASNLARLDDGLVAHGSRAFLIAFLVVHGVVKLVLVYCLLRKWHRVYPWALAVLTLFLAYQVYALATGPSIGNAVFTVIDAAIIVLVWREYLELRRYATEDAGIGASPSDAARP